MAGVRGRSEARERARSGAQAAFSDAAGGSERAVFLVGMMGAGKSSVGRALADRLGRAFIDTDAAIEQAAGQTIAQIFETRGEAGFRQLERDVVLDAARSGAIVALGGGAYAQPGLAEALRERGLAVYLCARPDTLCERTRADGERPLLAGLDAEARLERLRALLQERGPAYARADWQLDVDDLSAAAVAEEIAWRLADEPGLAAPPHERDERGERDERDERDERGERDEGSDGGQG